MALLREQFEEKSDALDQTRKDLFKVENDFLGLQKAWEEKNLEPSEEAIALAEDLKTMEDQCIEMENQVIFLQDFISTLLVPKALFSSEKTQTGIRSARAAARSNPNQDRSKNEG